VIHSPVTTGKKEFIELHNKISAALNLKSESNFIPHATIARVKGKCNPKNILSIIQNITFKEDFTASSFNLYKSTLTRKGPIYEVLESYKAKALK